MRDFPSCFGESGVQIADSTSVPKSVQNPATCVYETLIDGHRRDISIGWSRSLISISIADSSGNRTLSLNFDAAKMNKGSKNSHNRLNVFWDLSSAKFGSSAEPSECFYLAITRDDEMVLLLGDMAGEAYKKSGAKPASHDAVFVEKRERLLPGGNKRFSTEAKFRDDGSVHDVAIECEVAAERRDLFLRIRIDGRSVVLVEHLMWNFRGNRSVLVDGVSVEVLWDVYNWLFGTSRGSAAVFMFLTPFLAGKPMVSLSCSREVYGGAGRPGFSLLLYASKNED